MYPQTIQKLIALFSKFPTVGPRTAARFVFYLLKKPKEEIDELVKSILNLKERIRVCSFCFNPFEGETNLCPICSDPRRNKTLLCIVEKETDLTSIENTKKYQGLYFILGGTISKLKKEDIKNLRADSLIERLKNPANFGINTNFEEIILAINPTPEGEATTLYLERLLKPLNKKTTRLGRGLPVGGELEYADEETLSSALESRR
jgi:recombination protein RecR